VIENAAFGLEIAGIDIKERERRAMEVLEQVGLHAFAKHMPSQLSGGMQQRVGLARALSVNPSLMLMDEAFSALDPLRRTEMQDVLMKLQQEQKRTIVFVSHDLDEALRIGNRICIMEGGRVVQVGTSDDILQRPADEYVKAFFNGVDTNKYLTAKDVAQKEQVTIFECSDDPSEGFSAALARMRMYDRVYAFVLDAQHKVVGVVSVESLMQFINQPNKTLRDAILPGKTAIPGAMPLNEVMKKVVDYACPLPVVDERGEYIGAITKTVLLRKLCKENKA
jgi:glycine betaine/proline transport system ATP-binding protein